MDQCCRPRMTTTLFLLCEENQKKISEINSKVFLCAITSTKT